MSELRALIRELLSEEIAALRAEIGAHPQAEAVRVGSEAELTDFALAVARRAQEPGFIAALEAGRIRFSPEAPAAAPAPTAKSAPPEPSRPAPATQTATIVATMPPTVPELRKSLVTERDIAAVAQGQTRLRVLKTARLTPLAGDEARRRAIRIERTLA